MKKIVVLGKERSGTKWLTNLIANHPSVACIQSEKHNGVLESNMFDKMEVAFGDLAIYENRYAFYTCFTATSFFKISSIDRNWPFEQQPENYISFFASFMNKFAEENGKTCWIQKTNSSNGEKIFKRLPDAKIIIIKRNLLDTLKSSLFREGRKVNLKTIILSVLGYYHSEKEESKLRKHSLHINYEDLKNNHEATIKKVFNYLDLDYQKEYSTIKFKPNTTFKEVKNKSFSTYQKIVIEITKLIATVLPLTILKWMRNRIHSQRENKRRFVVGTFD